MKKYIKILLMIPIIFLMTGCLFIKEYKRSDIIDFVKDKYGLKKFSVSKKSISQPGDDGYDDDVWTVVDKVNNITFHVYNHAYYTMEHVENTLDDDYIDKYYSKYKNNIKNINNIFEFNYEEAYGVDKIGLGCIYNNKAEIDECYKSLKNINDYYSKKIKNFDMNYTLYYEKEMSYDKKEEEDYAISYESLQKYRNYLKHFKLNIEGMLSKMSKLNTIQKYKKYYEYGYYYQISSIINEVSQEEKEMLFKHEDIYNVYKINNNKLEKKYDNFIANGSSISIETMYYLLKEEGYNPIGTPDTFAVYNKQGDKYEFSEGFDDFIFNDKYLDYYYKKNGEKIGLNWRYSYDYSTNKLNEFFGLNIETVTNRNYSQFFDEEGNYIYKR